MKIIYPGIKQAISLCIMLLLLQLLAGAILGLLFPIEGLESFNENNIIKELSNNIAVLLPSIIVILLGFKRAELSFHEVFRFDTFQKEFILPIIIAVFGFGIVSSEADNVFRYFLPMPDFIYEIFKDLFTGSMITVIMIALIVPICEETIFRGLILNGFLSRYSEKKSILISALMFMLIHLNPYQFFSAFLGGVFLACIYYVTRSLWLCIFAHALNNFSPFFFGKILGLEIPGFIHSDFQPVHGEFQPLWLDIMGIVMLALGIYYFIKKAGNDNLSQRINS
ncbi:type II CAAX prenyl endopeptidase Rce1 family protein [Thermodesulfobacteriota bacterium]